MLTKADLRKQFSKEWEKHYNVKLFKEQGYQRKHCKSCGKFFWTLDEKRELCADPPCENYEFIGRDIGKKMNYIEVWKNLEKYFVKNSHESVKRYPVLCRWRPDLYFTNASIINFQRWEKGRITFEYPAEKLIVPQPSLRFSDIPNVGVTGRHMTSFVMIGQHSFGYPDTGYWKDECLDHNFQYMTDVFGIPPKELVYIEDAWAMPDMSAFGPSIETFSNGLELVTNVFMEFTLRNGKVEELPLKVIDVGIGHGRLAWFLKGTPTEYDAVFGPVLEHMKSKISLEYDKEFFMKYARLAGALNIDEVPNIAKARAGIAKQLGVSVEELQAKIDPLQALYAVADHARTLLFAISDGGLPSNVGGGYNLRVILRRGLEFIDEFNFPFTLQDVAEWHAKYLEPMYPELKNSLTEFNNIISVEERRYKDTITRNKGIVAKLLEKTTKPDVETLTKLYESNGVTLELVEKIALDLKKQVKIPADFYSKMAIQHESRKIEKPKQEFDVTAVKETELLYYKDPKLSEFKATVVKVWPRKGRSGHNFVVLDKTSFYPEGGGQAADKGEIRGMKVVDVKKEDNVIIHELDGKLAEGDDVICHVAMEHRDQLMRHHTATHVVNGAARRVLGNHVWQAGAEKTYDKARLDITHYENLTPEQAKEIENLANDVVKEGCEVTVTEMPRKEAEKKYGFRLYQGGAVPGKTIRVIDVADFDIEACGGLHVSNTKDIGEIKLIKSSRIQDGVVRLEFVAGKKLLKKVQRKVHEQEQKEKDQWLRKITKILNQKMKLGGKLPEKNLRKLNIEELQIEWKKHTKELELLKKKLSEKKEISKDKVQFVDKADMRMLENIGKKIVQDDENACVVLVSKGVVFGITGKKCKCSIEKAVTEAAKIMGGSAGQKGDEWKGGGPAKEKSRAAFERAKEMLK